MTEKNLFRCWNEAAVKADYTKMSWNQLQEEFTSADTVLNEIQAKYGDETTNWKSEDTEKYKQNLTIMQNVRKEQESRPDHLREQRSVLNIVPSAVNLGNAIGDLHTRVRNINEYQDPRFGYAEGGKGDRDFLVDCIKVLGRGEVSPRIEKVLNAVGVGADEYKSGDWKAAGIAIPEGFLSTVLETEREADPFMSSMTSVPMSVPSLSIPSRVDKDHSTTVSGGTVVYRTSETRTVDFTKVQMEAVKLEATEVVGASAATKQLLRHSAISIPALIRASMADAYTEKYMDETILGDGVGKFLGFLNSNNPSLVSVSRAAGTADTSIINGIDILLMRKRVWGYQNAFWVFNYDLMEHIAQLHIESANNAGIIKLYAPAQGDVPETLLGRPIVWTEYMPGIYQNDGTDIGDWGLANNGHFAACVNMTQYLKGTLYEEEAVSTHVRFMEREEVIQFVQCNDARPWWKSVLTPKRGANTRSPFVALNNTSVAS